MRCVVDGRQNTNDTCFSSSESAIQLGDLAIQHSALREKYNSLLVAFELAQVNALKKELKHIEEKEMLQKQLHFWQQCNARLAKLNEKLVSQARIRFGYSSSSLSCIEEKEEEVLSDLKKLNF